jgi:type II secretory pathway predicted ATPase ExeA
MRISAYLEHFGLHREAFSVTSDPTFLYLSESHEEALAHLVFCVEMRKGFAAIIGEIGTGKTTLLNELLTRLDDNYSVAFVYQSATTTQELMHYIFHDLELPDPGGDKTSYLEAFNAYLIKEDQAGRDVVLVIDEGQNLSVEVLEDLRLISNFETPAKKLIQIILAGQSELGVKLKRPELRQLNQRIAIQYKLKPLSPGETVSYVQHRLSIAGASRVDIFQPKALRLLQAASGGVPRLVNQVCDAALLRASLAKEQVITPKIVRQVLKDDFEFRGEAEQNQDHLKSGVLASTPVGSIFKKVAVSAVLVIAMGGSWLLGRGGFSKEPSLALTQVLSTIVDEPVNSTIATITQVPSGAIEVLASDDGDVQEIPAPVSLQEETAPVLQSGLVQHKSLSEGQSVPMSKRSVPVKSTPVKGDGEAVQVLPGNSLSQLLIRTYGFSDWSLIDRVLQENPRILNPNIIRVGDWVFLPKISSDDLSLLRARQN